MWSSRNDLSQLLDCLVIGALGDDNRQMMLRAAEFIRCSDPAREAARRPTHSRALGFTAPSMPFEIATPPTETPMAETPLAAREETRGTRLFCNEGLPGLLEETSIMQGFVDFQREKSAEFAGLDCRSDAGA